MRNRLSLNAALLVSLITVVCPSLLWASCPDQVTSDDSRVTDQRVKEVYTGSDSKDESDNHKATSTQAN